MDGFLNGYRVLDLTDEKGHLCGRILGDMGADVIKIEPPTGDPARLTGPFFQGKRDPEKSLSWLYANANKRGIALDLDSAEGRKSIERLASGADIVLESFKPGCMDRKGLGYSSLRRINPKIILVSLSAYGQTGPYRDFETTELISAATGGLVRVFGDADRPPVRISTPQSYYIGSQHAALGAVAALHHREETGKGQWVEVSIQEAVVQSLTYLIQHADRSGAVGLRSGTDVRTRIRPAPLGDLAMRWRFPCRDGYVFFSVQGAGGAPIKSARAMTKWANEEGYALDIGTYQWETWDSASIKQEQQDLLQDAFAPFIATKTKAELLERAAAHRMLLAPVNTVADLPDNPQLAHRGYWQQVQHPGLNTAVTYPGPFAKVDALPLRIRRRAPRIGEHDREIAAETESTGSRQHRAPEDRKASAAGKPVFEGLKVVDLTVAIAGPLIARFLASEGAEVIKVENHAHPDSVRTVAPFKDMAPGYDRSTQFAHYNYSKKSIAIDCGRPGGRDIVVKLIEWADILVENMAPGVMARWRLDYENARRINPNIIYLSSSSLGRTGPLANYAAWGYHHSPLVGVSHLVGWPDRKPCADPIAYTDSLAPAFSIIALAGALVHRKQTGKGIYIDQSQVEAGSYFLGPAILDYSVNGIVAARNGNRDPHMAPHGVFPCAGEEQWVAIAVPDDTRWIRLCKAARKEEWLQDRFEALEGRKRNEDELERMIAEWTSQYPSNEVVRRLQSAGIPSGNVATALDLLKDPQLIHRSHFGTLVHEEIGEHIYERSAIRFPEAAHPPQRPAPLLGEHTGEVLEMLGYNDDEIAECLIDGTITTDEDLPGMVSA